MSDDYRELFVRCSCWAPEHQLIFSYWTDDEDAEIYVQVHLERQSFWRRLRYLFGYRSRYGAFEEIVLREEQIAAVERFFTEYRSSALRDSGRLPKGEDSRSEAECEASQNGSRSEIAQTFPSLTGGINEQRN